MTDKLNADQFNELIDKTQKYKYLCGSTMRTGQAYMNVLSELNKPMYDEVTGTDQDPFYSGERLPSFFRYIGDESVNEFLNLKHNG